MSALIDGPDRYWSEDLAASRGQMATIAHAACELLGMPPPQDSPGRLHRDRAAASRASGAACDSEGAAGVVSGLRVTEARSVLPPVEWASVVVEQAATDLAARRIGRLPRPRSGPQPRCRSCHRFKTSHTSPCACGFDPILGWAA